MQVDPGNLKHKIVIKNMNGDEFHTCYASVNQLSGTETVRNNVSFDQVPTRFLIRYTPKLITSEMTVVYDGFEYDIQCQPNDYYQEHRYMEITTIKRSFMVVN